MIALLYVLAFPAGLAAGVWLGLKYWNFAVAAAYEGPSKMRPVREREPFAR